MPSTTRDRTRAPRASTPCSILWARLCVALLTVWRLVKNFTAQIWEPVTVGTLTDHQSCPHASTTQLRTLSPAAISPLGTRARFTGSLLIRFDSLYTVTGRVSVFILTHHNSPLGTSGTGTRTRSPGASSPLVSSKHVGAARAVNPGMEVLVLIWVNNASAWDPLRTWCHGTVLVGLWDIIWVTLTPINHVVAVVDTHHLAGCLTLPTSHGTRAPV